MIQPTVYWYLANSKFQDVLFNSFYMILQSRLFRWTSFYSSVIFWGFFDDFNRKSIFRTPLINFLVSSIFFLSKNNVSLTYEILFFFKYQSLIRLKFYISQTNSLWNFNLFVEVRTNNKTHRFYSIGTHLREMKNFILKFGKDPWPTVRPKLLF